MASHPSASHFMSSGFFLPDSTVTNDFHASSRKMDTPNQPWKVGFNRVRGFTQQLYIDSLESAERARLAHETRVSFKLDILSPLPLSVIIVIIM